MNKIECAVSCFKEGFSCSQALLSTYGPQFDLNREMALRVSGAFGGGIGHMGETCGAVTGVIMVIGLKYGKTRAEDEQIEEKAYSLIQEFVDKFNSRNGSIICRELLGYDISTPEGMKLAKEKNLFITICPKLVQDAAEIIEQILE
ncbi:MAG: C_GCAxxG_C_C family protein [Candidatus Methanomarinus sp.]|uniref:C_GCAxxG_C_C family protein n=1 Tax=Candidatus Methanomarinus sp. TaxID=3386244 RepID=A0AC61S9Y7_9EURY|nr:MAG: C_GCAxxG_C_C family protein [ANME-2 cluster archaeon]